MSSTNNSLINYNLWVKQIDNYIFNLIDIHLNDLPDNTFRLDFEETIKIQLTNPYNAMPYALDKQSSISIAETKIKEIAKNKDLWEYELRPNKFKQIENPKANNVTIPDDSQSLKKQL